MLRLWKLDNVTVLSGSPRNHAVILHIATGDGMKKEALSLVLVVLAELWLLSSK